jgi:hypothetical protein
MVGPRRFAGAHSPTPHTIGPQASSVPNGLKALRRPQCSSRRSSLATTLSLGGTRRRGATKPLAERGGGAHGDGAYRSERACQRPVAHANSQFRLSNSAQMFPCFMCQLPACCRAPRQNREAPRATKAGFCASRSLTAAPCPPQVFGLTSINVTAESNGTADTSGPAVGLESPSAHPPPNRMFPATSALNEVSTTSTYLTEPPASSSTGRVGKLVPMSTGPPQPPSGGGRPPLPEPPGGKRFPTLGRQRAEPMTCSSAQDAFEKTPSQACCMDWWHA